MVTAAERRAVVRWVPRDTWSDARIRAGAPARILDCSPDGLRLATQMRLMPGRRCTVAWPLAEGRPSASGAVVRCHVGTLSGAGVHYHAAIRFDQVADFLGEGTTRAG